MTRKRTPKVWEDESEFPFTPEEFCDDLIDGLRFAAADERLHCMHRATIEKAVRFIEAIAVRGFKPRLSETKLSKLLRQRRVGFEMDRKPEGQKSGEFKEQLAKVLGVTPDIIEKDMSQIRKILKAFYEKWPHLRDIEVNRNRKKTTE
jgi:hypothetical protein